MANDSTQTTTEKPIKQPRFRSWTEIEFERAVIAMAEMDLREKNRAKRGAQINGE